MRRAALNKKIPAAAQKNDVKPKNNKQENMSSVISNLVHNLPLLPSCELTSPHDDITLPRLIEALQNRHRIRQMIIDEYSKAADMMKSMIREVDKNLMSTDSVIHEQNSKLVEKDRIIQNNKAEMVRLERRTETQEHKIDILQKTTKFYEDDKRLLQQELETREQRLQRELSDKRHMKQHMHSVVTETELKWEKECDRRVTAMELEMQNKLWVKDEKLKQLKAIVMESKTPGHPDSPPNQTHPELWSREEYLPAKRLASPSPVPCPADSHVRSESGSELETGSGPVRATRDEENEMNPRSTCPIPSDSSPLSVTSCISAWQQWASQDGSQSYHTPRTTTRTQSPAGTSANRARRRAMCLSRNEEANSPTTDLDITERSYRTVTPVRPLHRRSRCAGGEKWVDHKPSSSMDLGTVLQPVIPNAIQVSAPSEKALSKCDKYVLTHQEVASDGEIQTRLIKLEPIFYFSCAGPTIWLQDGEVIKTRGGGQAVQFTDIETLKQELTTVQRRKVRSSQGKPPNEDHGNVERECPTAVEMRAGSNMAPVYGHHQVTKRRKR